MGINGVDLKVFAGEFIKRATKANAVKLDRFEQLAGGAVQENYAMDVELSGGVMPGLHQLVLRTDAVASLDASLSRAAEFEVLSVAWQAGVLVPEPLWLHVDEGELGGDFYLMRRVAGDASARDLVRGDLSGSQREGLLAQLGETLASLHGITPEKKTIGALPAPELPPAIRRIQEYRCTLDKLRNPHPTLELALRWLELNAPRKHRVVLTHGDFRTGNYMVEDGQLTGVLDWEFAGWSDPVEDLGWFCARCWRFGEWEREAGGIGPLDALLSAYERKAGWRPDVTQLHYWRVMATVRWAVIALLQAERHLSGEQPSLELALTGRMLPEIELDLLQEILPIAEKEVSNA